MAKTSSGVPSDASRDNSRLVTGEDEKAKAAKWFQRARELGEKRQFDYAIEYYVNGLEFWPDAVEEACKPLHGCAVARRQFGGKRPGLMDTMKRSTSDKDPRKAFVNSLWLFGHDPDHPGYIEAVTRSASRLRADDAARWAGGVYLKALETAAKPAAKQFQALAQMMEELGDRAAARGEGPFAVTVYQMGVNTLSVWKRRFPDDDKADAAVKNLSSKLTITKGKYETSESYRESIHDVQAQVDLHDAQRSVQSEDRVEDLIAKAEEERERNPDHAGALKQLVDLLCRREREEDETRAIGLLVQEYDRAGEYRWKHLADDIRMKQLGRKGREVQKSRDLEKIKEHRTQQLRFELTVFKERVERYPTDHRIRFEYAVRNFEAGRYDEAIPLFQASRVDPKNRAACGMYLGRCFFRKGYHSQAVEALQEAVSQHEFQDDDAVLAGPIPGGFRSDRGGPQDLRKDSPNGL
jgi:tetratricopeptide (TPR) repeat protein